MSFTSMWTRFLASSSAAEKKAKFKVLLRGNFYSGLAQFEGSNFKHVVNLLALFTSAEDKHHRAPLYKYCFEEALDIICNSVELQLYRNLSTDQLRLMAKLVVNVLMYTGAEARQYQPSIDDVLWSPSSYTDFVGNDNDPVIHCLLKAICQQDHNIPQHRPLLGTVLPQVHAMIINPQAFEQHRLQFEPVPEQAALRIRPGYI